MIRSHFYQQIFPAFIIINNNYHECSRIRG